MKKLTPESTESREAGIERSSSRSRRRLQICTKSPRLAAHGTPAALTGLSCSALPVADLLPRMLTAPVRGIPAKAGSRPRPFSNETACCSLATRTAPDAPDPLHQVPLGSPVQRALAVVGVPAKRARAPRFTQHGGVRPMPGTGRLAALPRRKSNALGQGCPRAFHCPSVSSMRYLVSRPMRFFPLPVASRPLQTAVVSP